MNEEDESERLVSGRAEAPQASLPYLSVFPPLPLEIDEPEQRLARLADVVAELVIPRLVNLHSAVPRVIDRTAEVAELARLVLGPDNDDAADYLMSLRDSGVSLDQLHTELLEPAAVHLGELWQDDKIDFVDVTLGVSKLQRLVHVFERLDQIGPYDDKRRVLIAAAPGEQHSFGSAMVQKFLRAGGWHVFACSTQRIEEAADVASREWFGVVGFSINSDVHLDDLGSAIGMVRKSSLNPAVRIMVGGTAIQRNPAAVARAGADGTAANGPAAVVLAKKLLAASLTSA